MKDKNYISIYIHIPFCRKKCGYCDFYSLPVDPLFKNFRDEIKKDLEKKLLLIDKENKQFEIPEKLFNSYLNEIKFYSYLFQDKIVDTIYIGGGTPSLINYAQIEKLVNYIFNNFKISLKEFTFEINPEDISNEKIKYLKSINVNRVSIGIQSFNTNALKTINRAYVPKNFKDVLKKIEIVKKYFNNFSLDLIIGIPENPIEFEIKTLLNISPPHISLYMLTLYEETDLYIKFHDIIDQIDEKAANDYSYVQEKLNQHGYIHYEISNFAISNYFFSKHNLKYWTNNYYIGIGPSASGYIFNIRYKNANINNYINFYKDFLFQKKYLKNKKIELINYYKNNKKFFNYIEFLNEKELKEEYIFLSLRTILGLNLDEYNKIFKNNLLIEKKQEINRLINENKIILNKNILKINPEFYKIFNSIVIELI